MTSRPRLSIALLGNGASVQIQRLAAALGIRGHVVSVITPDKYLPYPDIPGVRFYPFQSALNPIAKLRQIRSMIQKISPDVLHSHYVTHGGFMGVGTGFHPHLMSAWGCDILNHPNDSKLMYLKTSLALRAADLALPVSKQMETRMREIGGDRIVTEVFTWGIDVKRFARTQAGAESFRARFGLQGKKIVFSPRRLEPLYNHHSLFEAWPEVRKRFPDARLVMIENWGIPEYEASLRQIARERGFHNDVVWIGVLSMDELAGAYSATDALVSIPRTDGTPMTVLEAMACGTPLVACDIPSVRAWITPDKGGILVKPEQPALVGEAVVRLLQATPEWKQEMAGLNREIILARADSQKLLDALEELYIQASAKKGVDWLQTLRNLTGIRRTSP